MNTFTPKCAFSALTLLICANCATPPEVLELAETTASNTSIVNTQLNGFARSTRRISERRADVAAELSEAAESAQAEFDTFFEGARVTAAIAGQEEDPNLGRLATELQRLSEVVRERQEAVQIRRAVIRQEILSSQVPVSEPKSDLATISKKLGMLAKDSSRKEVLDFLKAFFQSVVKEIQKAKGDAEKNEENAVTRAKNANSVLISPN